MSQDFPGGPVIKTPCSHCRDHGSIHGQETKILQAVRVAKTKKQKQKKIIISYVSVRLRFENTE